MQDVATAIAEAAPNLEFLDELPQKLNQDPGCAKTIYQVLHVLRSTRCDLCGDRKWSGMIMCPNCHDKLTPQEKRSMQLVLKRRFVHAYLAIKHRLTGDTAVVPKPAALISDKGNLTILCSVPVKVWQEESGSWAARTKNYEILTGRRDEFGSSMEQLNIGVSGYPSRETAIRALRTTIRDYMEAKIS